MKQYLDILRNIVENGVPKQPVRVGPDGTVVKVENGTIGLANQVFSHDMKDGFPLLTTRKLPIRSTAVELEGFINGINSKAWYKERKCSYWDHWCNPLKIQERVLREGEPTLEVRKQWMREEDDLGNFYPMNWRGRGSNKTDQLLDIVKKLKNNPYDRRMICSAWFPDDIPNAALPSCHMIFNIVVYGNTLNLCWTQRSVDYICGAPANISSYALLLLLLCKVGNFEPGNLTGMLNDCHVYENHIEGAKEMLRREPKELPTLTITGQEGEEFDLFKWTHKDFFVYDYEPLEAIKFEVTV